jgi:energy-coupling factor transporter ATP-binding protein EcfA2
MQFTGGNEVRDDRAVLNETISSCLYDKRVTGYFLRRLVNREEVFRQLAEADTFSQAMNLASYQAYSDIRERVLGVQRQADSQALNLRSIISRASGVTSSLARVSDLQRARDSWLSDAVEEVIIPNVILAINTILGKDQDLLLVEQDSEGLRRLQDPTFRVPTRTRERLTSLLSQMDGGSVAVAGPRGAGKSTLLKQFGTPLNDDITSARTIAIYVPAPSNYIVRDFIAELFQRLCEAYLSYCDYPVSEELYRIGRSRIAKQRLIRKVSRICWLTIRAAIALGILLWVSWFIAAQFVATHSKILRSPNFPRIHRLSSDTGKLVGEWWHSYHAYFLLAIVLVAVWVIWPPIRLWSTNLPRSQEPELIKHAREYLLRLRVDKTVTRGANVGWPSIQGLRLTLDRSSAVKYTPWSLPELVSYTRRFIEDISLQMKELNRSSRPVVVAIDEIDRIGSIEDAEGFLGEIKAIFGAEGCYFLVAVAEDVGSLFAQRATAGRSILENAFDEIVTVGPLTLLEARSLLLKRVPGFTDAFVYLVYAMSGGLPRELIRVTRRLIEINLEQLTDEHHPRLEDLALTLVTESMIDVLDASRNQMSQLTLGPRWADYFESMRSAISTLQRNPSLPDSLYQEISKISKINVPYMVEGDGAWTVKTPGDEDPAAQILNRLSAFAYFAVTIIDAFSDSWFNLAEAKRRTEVQADNSYEELASARIELSVSYASARLILDRFRSSLVDEEF